MPELRMIPDEHAVPVNQTLCEICEKQFSNYVCPRCNLRYCSLVCYKHMNHAECTESFYKESVTQEIKSRDIDKDSKMKMLEVLQRLEEDNQNESESEDELEDRLANIDINSVESKVLWDLLSDQEKKEFENVLNELEHTGTTQLNISYQPWWTKDVSSKIKVVEDDIDDDEEEEDRPPIPSNLPNFERMAKTDTRSSPHLAWNLLHILATYSYLMRHSLGSPLDDPLETIRVIQTLSAKLLFSTAAECPFHSAEDVITDSIDAIIQIEDNKRLKMPNTSKIYELKCMLLSDMAFLLKEKTRAVHHFWSMLEEIKRVTKVKSRPFTLAIHKLYFYFGAAYYLGNDHLQLLLMTLDKSLSKTVTERDNFIKERSVAEEAIQMNKKVINKITEL